MAPPAYSSLFGPEGWESVGVTYSSFFGPEGWESPITYSTFFGPEGWESPITYSTFFGPEAWEKVFSEADHITMSLSPANPTLTGETVTVSGRVTQGRLNPTAEADITATVEVYDDSEELLQSVQATTDANGDYSADVTLKSQASAFIRVTTNRKGAIVPFGGSAVEGWES